MFQKIHLILYVFLFFVGCVVGSLWFKGCMVKSCPEIFSETIYEIPDSTKALIYADGFVAGKQSVAPIIKTKILKGDVVTVFKPDLESQLVATQLFGLIDSLILENGKIQDLVMYDKVVDPRYKLHLFARIKERSFRGTTIELIDQPVLPNPQITFWDRWGFGPQLGVGVGTQVEQSQNGTQLKFRPTLYLGFGVHYELK
jgi:hypothetical protein